MTNYDDILNGKYNKNGFEIYRIFRDENETILKIVFFKDNVFLERTLEQTLNGEF